MKPSSTSAQTPEQHAAIVVQNVRDHELFNVVTDATWTRFIAQQITLARAQQIIMEGDDGVALSNMVIHWMKYHDAINCNRLSDAAWNWGRCREAMREFERLTEGEP